MVSFAMQNPGDFFMFLSTINHECSLHVGEKGSVQLISGPNSKVDGSKYS